MMVFYFILYIDDIFLWKDSKQLTDNFLLFELKIKQNASNLLGGASSLISL